MGTVMEYSFNAAGYFAARRPGMIAAARRQMAAHLLAERRREVAARVLENWKHLDREDLEFAVREMSARVSRKSGAVVLPWMRGWALAGAKRRAS